MKRNLKVIVSVLGLASGLALIIVGGISFWYYHRPLPASTHQKLFESITYIRDIRHNPRPLVIHVVLVDLETSKTHFLVTPGDPASAFEINARTTSQFLDEFDVQLAINGDFFTPWYSNSPWDYYPHAGDSVDVTGFASSEGRVYSRGKPNHPTLYISSDNQFQVDRPIGKIFNAISGNLIFVDNGEIRDQLFASSYYHTDLHPRTAIGLDDRRETLILFVIDGRQPNYSEGVTMLELAEIALEYGADIALNLDGGGSTTLVIEGESGEPIILNSPIDNRIPGRERAVANHLGIYAESMTNH